MIDCKTIKNNLEDYVTIWKTFKVLLKRAEYKIESTYDYSYIEIETRAKRKNENSCVRMVSLWVNFLKILFHSL